LLEKIVKVAGISSEYEACQYIDKEISLLFRLKQEYEEELLNLAKNPCPFCQKVISISSFANFLYEFYQKANSGTAFSLELNNRTCMYYAPDFELSKKELLKINENYTILLFNEYNTKLPIFPHPNVKIIQNLSPFRSFETIFHKLNYEFSLEEVFF